MHLLLKHKRIWLALLTLVSLLMVWSFQYLKVDFSFDRFYPKDDPESQFYQDFKKTFPHNDNLVQVAFTGPDSSLFEWDFLNQVDSAFHALKAIEHVDSVLAPTQLQVYRRTSGEPKGRPLFDLKSEKRFTNSIKRIKKDSLLRLYQGFFSPDRKYLAGILLLNPDILDAPVRDKTTKAIIQHLDETGLEYVISGIPVARTAYVAKIRNEMLVFVGFSIFLTMLILFLLYRKIWGVLVPLAGVILALVWCIGFMGATGKSLDLMIELLPPIMFVVGMADVVHLVTKYIQELQDGKSKEEAMQKTLSEIGIAILLTSITTAIGFGSMFISRMPPIKEFGIYAAAGVMFAYIISVILIPNILLKIPPEKLINQKGFGNKKIWEKYLNRLYNWGRIGSGRVMVLFGVLIAVSAFGISRISFDSYLMDDISSKDPIRTSITFFEDHFYGMRPFELQIEAKGDREVTDMAIMQEMDRIQNWVKAHLPVSPYLSPVDFVKNANRLYHSNRQEHYVLPESQDKIDEYFGFGYAYGAEKYLNTILTKDRKKARISARSKDIGTDSSGKFTMAFEKWIRDSTDLSAFDYHITGTAILTERNVQHLRESLLSGLLLAFALVALIMGLLYRSWKMLIIGILPNIIPLVFTAGVMGFMGISLKASTSIVFLISFGIAVDDTIHFLSRLRLELREGNDIETAIRNTMLGTGKALVLTTVILLTGFFLLLFSDFGGTFVVGLFTAITLVFALFSDLLLIPLLIRIAGLKGYAKHKEEPGETTKSNPEEEFSRP